MSTKKKIISSLIVVLSALLVGLFVWRVVEVNLKYPAPVLKSCEKGETLNYLDTFEITVMDTEFLSDEQAQELFDVENAFGDVEQKYLVTTLHVKNISDEPQRFPVYELTFQSGAFFNGGMYQFLESLNGWVDVPEQQPDEELTIKLPLNIPKTRFRDSQWETVTQRQYEIVLRLYPEKYVLKL